MEVVQRNNINRLIKACQKGDHEAQYAIYEQYAKPMFNTAMRIINDHMEAEDVLQDSFVAMFSSLDSFRREATFGAWFKRIVVNKSLNAIRAKSRQVITSEGDIDTLANAADSIESADEFPYSVEQVKEGLEEMPDGYRIVFSLFLFEGLSHQEIAHELQIGESTSKTQYLRAKKWIRKWLNDKYGKEE